MIQFLTMQILSAALLTFAVPEDALLQPPAYVLEKSWDDPEEARSALEDPAFFKALKTYVEEVGLLKGAPLSPVLTLQFETLFGDVARAEAALAVVEKNTETQAYGYFHFRLFLDARKRMASGLSREAAYAQAFQGQFKAFGDAQALDAGYYTGYNLDRGYAFLQGRLKMAKEHGPWDAGSMRRMMGYVCDVLVHKEVLTHTVPLLEQEYKQRFRVAYAMVKTPSGAQLSTIRVLPKDARKPLPGVLMFNIYPERLQNLRSIARAALYGYAGVMAAARGKRESPDAVNPYETEVEDVNAVIDWMSRQTWCNGSVGMYGGSYLGFAQWAAAKQLHPALKTMVPSAAALPGQGLPMENNIFLTANYGWVEFVTTNKTLNYKTYSDENRWNRLLENYYQKGVAFRSLDALDGTPNSWLQRWLKHPAYDAYWQSMVPYGEDYARINIPILSITGYYDDGQISALHFLDEHVKHRPDAPHYLVIGPYDHWTTQSKQQPELRGYRLDPSAHVDVEKLTFQWFDHIFKGAKRPHPVRDRINLQVMGGDQWRHLSGWEDLKKDRSRFYLSKTPSEVLGNARTYGLRKQAGDGKSFLTQTVDLADRSQPHNNYYPWPIVKDSLEVPNGFAFVSEPFEKDVVVQGRFSGAMRVRINKKDMDLGLVFYERTAEGQYHHLSYFLGRASFAEDMTQRKLLEPGVINTIPFERSRMTGKLLKKGSRLVALVNINKNRNAQINYGTGRDVSDETIADAGAPLTIDWFTDSYIEIQMTDWNGGPAKPKKPSRKDP